MKKSLIHFGLGVFVAAFVVSFATQASARHYISSNASAYRSIIINYTPQTDQSVFGVFNINNGSGFSGTLHIFAPMTPILRDGGDDHGDDTSGGGDTLGGPGDTNHHCGGGHGGDDSTGGGFGFGDRDSTDGGDTNHHEGGGPDDSLGSGDLGGNDTVDCHHHGDDDTTVVTDTSTHKLFGSGSTSIVVKSHGQKANVSIVFTNNLSTSVKISNIALASGRNFQILRGAPSRTMTLAAGASIKLTVAFNAADNAVHADQLVVVSNSAQSLNTISLKGQVTAAASVSNTLPQGVTITAMPNPMTSSLKVDLTGVESASVAIYDMRGNSVLTSSLSSSEWIWNGTATDGSLLPAGSYIVRLSGVSSTNQAFISTQKIILRDKK